MRSGLGVFQCLRSRPSLLSILVDRFFHRSRPAFGTDHFVVEFSKIKLSQLPMIAPSLRRFGRGSSVVGHKPLHDVDLWRGWERVHALKLTELLGETLGTITLIIHARVYIYRHLYIISCCYCCTALNARY